MSLFYIDTECRWDMRRNSRSQASAGVFHRDDPEGVYLRMVFGFGSGGRQLCSRTSLIWPLGILALNLVARYFMTSSDKCPILCRQDLGRCM